LHGNTPLQQANRVTGYQFSNFKLYESQLLEAAVSLERMLLEQMRSEGFPNTFFKDLMNNKVSSDILAAFQYQ